MAHKLKLTLACGDYEIMRALKEGIVRPEGIELTVLTDMAPSPRHWRFLREGQAAAKVSHPNVVQVFEAGLHQGQPYLVMELLEGETLRDRLSGKAKGYMGYIATHSPKYRLTVEQLWADLEQALSAS